jgi:ribosome-associated toxin RatA of RatAB toxin-antitoxin module
VNDASATQLRGYTEFVVCRRSDKDDAPMTPSASLRSLVSVPLLAAALLLTNSRSARADIVPPVSDVVRSGEIESTIKPHPGIDVQWGRAVGIVDAPADSVMAVLQNYGSYKDFLPNFQASRVLSQRGSSALVYMQVSVMHGAAKIWVEVKLRELPVQGTTRTIECTMTKGNVDQFKAIWQVTPYDPQRSVVAFQILVDPDLPLPTSFVNDENLKNARKAVRALRTRLAQVAASAGALAQSKLAPTKN